MKKGFLITVIIISFLSGTLLNVVMSQRQEIVINTSQNNSLSLGAFSISLSVNNLNSSKEFYEKLGFNVFGGNIKSNYLIMKNGNAIIGLFQGMFQGNILTFNPGWDENAQNLNKFIDIRDIQKQLKQKGINLLTEVNENTKGAASLTLKDPDGNMILLDQHR